MSALGSLTRFIPDGLVQATPQIVVPQGIPGVMPCVEGVNPATWMLQVTALGPEQKLGVDFADLYLESEQCRWED